MLVAVTGARGRVGQFVVAELLTTGHEVLAVTRSHWEECPCRQVWADILEPSSLSVAFEGCDAVIHLAALPSPSSGSEQQVFRSNAEGTYNVLLAAGELGIRRASIASSDCAWGLTFNRVPFIPDYFPVDESHRVMPDNCYGIGKVTAERISDGMAQRYAMAIATMRITHVVRPFEYQEGSRFRNWNSDPTQGPANLWSYIDARDAAYAFRLGIEASIEGHQVFSINADVNRCTMPVHTLVERYYPGVPVATGFSDHASLTSNQKAKNLLGWEPRHRWEDDI